MADSNVQVQVRAAVAAAGDKKAEETRVLELGPADSALADYFVICSGNNTRQNQAVADEIEFRLKTDFGSLPNSVEGYRTGEWILMDYVDFVVHIFLTERREFYNIERLRSAATVFDVNRAAAKAKPAAKKLAARKKPAAKKAAKKAVKKPAARKKSSKSSKKK
jgi:ribosome-associated protein